MPDGRRVFSLGRALSRLCAALALLLCLLPGLPAGAEVSRPLDERATARLIADEVKRQAPGAEVKVAFGTLQPGVGVMRDGAGVWLEAKGIHQALRDAKDGRAREAVLQAFVADKLALAGRKKAAAAKRKFDTTKILPFIRSPEHGGVGGGDLRRAPFIGDLYQCWISLDAAGFGCLSTWQLPKTGFGRLEITKAGLKNLEARLGEVTEVIEGPVHKLRLDPWFGSSLILLDSYWIERAAGGSVTVAIPVEGELWWVLNADAATMRALRQEVRSRFDEAGRGEGPKVSWGNGKQTWMIGLAPLSRDLYRWTGTGWEVLPE